MKFFLINPDYMLYGDPQIGLAYLAAYLKKHCSFVKMNILDQLKPEKILEKIQKTKPEIIGFTAVSLNYAQVKKLAIKIKKISPASILLIGGVHITTSPESFNASPFDIAVRGEGEICTKKLINYLKKNKKISSNELSKIPGLLFREKDKIINTGLGERTKCLDEIPFPARELLNMAYYSLPRFSSEEDIEPIGSLLSSRGCPYSCKFCSSNCFWGNGVRFFSAERVIDEIELLHKKYNYYHLYFYDDLFSMNKERLKKIISGLREKNLLGKIKFSVYGRANCFDEETARLLQEMNVKNIIFGFETGSQRLLTFLKERGVTILDGVNAIKLAKKYNMNPGGFFMLGSPTETVKDMEETYNFIKQNCEGNFMIYQTIAFPGTYLWDYALKNKIMDKNFYEIEQKDLLDTNSNLLLSKEISKEQFVYWFKKIILLQKIKKTPFFKKICMIKSRHIKLILTKEFFRKSNNLKSSFFKQLN